MMVKHPFRNPATEVARGAQVLYTSVHKMVFVHIPTYNNALQMVKL